MYKNVECSIMFYNFLEKIITGVKNRIFVTGVAD